MSRQNVELVLGVIPPPEADLALLVRDDELWAQLAEAIGPFFHPSFKCVGRLVGDPSYGERGLNAFRAFWLDWLASWDSYRMSEIEQAIDCGDRVVVIVRDVGRPKGAEHEVRGRNAGIWTLREGQAIKWEGYPHVADALRAAGISQQS